MKSLPSVAPSTIGEDISTKSMNLKTSLGRLRPSCLVRCSLL